MDEFEERIKAFKMKLEARLSRARSGARVVKTEALKRSKEQLDRLEELFEEGWESASAEFIDTLHGWLEAEERSEKGTVGEASEGSEADEPELSPEEQAARRQAELEAKKKAIEERLNRAARHAGGAIVEVAEAARLHFSELEGDLIDGLDSLTKTASEAIDKWRGGKKKDEASSGSEAPKPGV